MGKIYYQPKFKIDISTKKLWQMLGWYKRGFHLIKKIK